MKAIGYIAVAIACGAFSAAASSATNANTKTCIDTFIEQEVGDRPTEVRIHERYIPPMPIVLRAELPLQLRATEKNTGRTIATAACDPRQGLVDVDRR